MAFTFSIEIVGVGYHVYKEIWKAAIDGVVVKESLVVSTIPSLLPLRKPRQQEM